MAKGGFGYDEVVEMGIAMPESMVIKEPPIEMFLAKDAFDFSHFVTDFKQDNSNDLQPIDMRVEKSKE